MGRFYNGDIEGKFWFGVQSSCDGEFFGAEGQEPGEIPYYAKDLEKAEEGVKECKKQLKGYLKQLNKFFKENDSYNDKMIHKQTGISMSEIKSLLKWYARLHLGKKILKCIKERGYCSFNAEL